MKEEDVIRRHWFSICSNPMWIVLSLGSFLLERFLDGGLLAHIWHTVVGVVPRGTTYSTVSEDLHVVLGIVFVAAGLSLLSAIAWWYVTTIELDDVALVVRTPFSSNSIPLAEIQDVQTSRAFLGMLFDFGTLLVYSGAEKERIDFVPAVENFAQSLYRHNK